MRRSAVIAVLMLSTPVAAQDAGGEAGAGEAQFNRQCVACHVIQDGAGETLAGRNARVGPNLYGVMGAAPGSADDFAYSASLVAYGETGVVWSEENLVSFLQDPTGHLRQALDDPRARSTMTHRLRNQDVAQDIHAFLARFPADEAAAEEQGQESAEDDAPDAEPRDLAAGEALYRSSCRNCHGNNAQGMASFPALAGLGQAHLEARLEQYRAGERVGPNSGLMIPPARNLTDEDIANVAAFIATSFD